jgi:hypothetical protein
MAAKGASKTDAAAAPAGTAAAKPVEKDLEEGELPSEEGEYIEPK